MWQPYTPQTNSDLAVEVTCPPTWQEGSQEKAELTAADIVGNVRRLSRDKDGCRFLQDTLANLETTSDADRVAIASEMRTHVWEVLRCPNANHVLQKCICVLRPQASQFILDELRQVGFSKAARHNYGCRVLQRLLEHCGAEQLQPVVEELLRDASALSRHVYGQYVMQHLLEHGSEAQVQRLCIILINDLPSVAQDISGVAVILSALDHAADEEKAQLVHSLLSTPGLIASFASSRHGHLAAKMALVLASDADRQAALLDLKAQHEHFKSSRYGRVFARFLEKCSQGEINSCLVL
jgi:pumilio RNA-binding family